MTNNCGMNTHRWHDWTVPWRWDNTWHVCRCYVAISVIWLVSNTGWLASAWSWISWQMLGALSNTPNAAWCTEYRIVQCRTCLEKWCSDMLNGVTHLDNIMYVVCVFISVVHEVDVDWVIQLYAAVTDITLSTGDISAASPTTSIQYSDWQLHREASYLQRSRMFLTCVWMYW